ncbi:MAG: 1,4-alpha-glucan branching protein GlgB [Thermodesulfobacteriota bacterium]|nr:MAG: 1,4-alpha-glucan branching protein GlgB [Thermodesulfobacteriota bacterium]
MGKTEKGPVVYGTGHITDHDIYLFKEGSHFNLYRVLGSHIAIFDGERGTHFALWAPNAVNVSVIGDFNGWDPRSHPLKVRDDWSGIWEGFIPSITEGAVYKYHIVSKYNGFTVNKADPFAFYAENPPKTASIVKGLGYTWGDSRWMEERGGKNSLNGPFSVYELHLGSWMRAPDKGNRFLNYRELAERLVDYIKETGFTHVELMPVMEHPFYGSWGYQTTGYFAPTSRYGTPQDFMHFVDLLHKNDIGVILDWVPSHFPSDEHGLGFFDGTHLYEHKDPRKGFHPDWKSFIFNYGRNEVRSFLISSALFWLDHYHLDGIRVDAVASMLYLDYSRKEGEWIPNEYGGNENLDAISLLKRLNEVVYEKFPQVQTIAEESTSWPAVSRPVYLGGLGFGMKWNMGWMHDTLEYFRNDPLFRKYVHNEITFSMWYAYSENFLLPLSHDEVVHGKGSILGKMPGDEWQRFANLRLLYGFMYGHPGKKLLFMGSEFGQVKEWDHEESLEWHVLQYPLHSGVKKWVSDLNRLYRAEKALHEFDFEQKGFSWVDDRNWSESVLSFIRNGSQINEKVLVVCNFTPMVRSSYRVGVPFGGFWREVLNSDAGVYGGSGQGNYGGAETSVTGHNGYPFSIEITLPPLSVLFFKPDG